MSEDTFPYDEEGYPLGSKKDDPITDLVLHLSGEKARLRERAFRSKTDYTAEMQQILDIRGYSLPEGYTVSRREKYATPSTYFLELRYKLKGQYYAFRVEVFPQFCKDEDSFNENLPYALLILYNTSRRYHTSEK